MAAIPAVGTAQEHAIARSEGVIPVTFPAVVCVRLMKGHGDDAGETWEPRRGVPSLDLLRLARTREREKDSVEASDFLLSDRLSLWENYPVAMGNHAQLPPAAIQFPSPSVPQRTARLRIKRRGEAELAPELTARSLSAPRHTRGSSVQEVAQRQSLSQSQPKPPDSLPLHNSKPNVGSRTHRPRLQHNPASTNMAFLSSTPRDQSLFGGLAVDGLGRSAWRRRTSPPSRDVHVADHCPDVVQLGVESTYAQNSWGATGRPWQDGDSTISFSEHNRRVSEALKERTLSLTTFFKDKLRQEAEILMEKSMDAYVDKRDKLSSFVSEYQRRMLHMCEEFEELRSVKDEIQELQQQNIKLASSNRHIMRTYRRELKDLMEERDLLKDHTLPDHASQVAKLKDKLVEKRHEHVQLAARLQDVTAQLSNLEPNMEREINKLRERRRAVEKDLASLKEEHARAMQKDQEEVELLEAALAEKEEAKSAALGSVTRVRKVINRLQQDSLDAQRIAEEAQRSDEREVSKGQQMQKELESVYQQKRSVFQYQLDQLADALQRVVTFDIDLEQSLSCLDCGQTLREPHVLWPCGHTICSTCVPTPASGEVIQCPVCAALGKDGRSSLEELKKTDFNPGALALRNRFAEDLLERSRWCAEEMERVCAMSQVFSERLSEVRRHRKAAVVTELARERLKHRN